MNFKSIIEGLLKLAPFIALSEWKQRRYEKRLQRIKDRVNQRKSERMRNKR